MATEYQEKSIKHIDYCYSFYFSNIFRPFSVSIYFCFGCFGLSGYFMETNPSSNAGVKYLYKKFTLSFNIKKDMISLTEYSPSFNIPTSFNTCWIAIYQLQINHITVISKDYRQRVNSPPPMICSTLTQNRAGKENPCYTQIRLQKILILEIKELHRE